MTKTTGTAVTPAAELKGWLARLTPATQARVGALRTALRKRFPTANELAYDYGHSIVLTYAPSERGIEGIASLSIRGDEVTLVFNKGPQLPDPKRLLRGSGRMTRHVVLESARSLAQPEVQAFLAAAEKLADVPLPKSGKGALIIRPTAAGKRAGRKAGK
ncbi:MAG: hypothetical protein IPK12_22205 [Gemmatimonadetes bacterium]|nr:hypothetical protein [Gemmatimonadota bacterium]